MEFGVLGPLLVRYAGADVPIGRGKPRTVLAALLLSAGRVVTGAELADALWGEAQPPSAQVAVRNYVMRLRHRVGDAIAARIQTQPPGYLIEVAPMELDTSRCEALLWAARAAGESGCWDAASSEAAAALALWRGSPLKDVESDALTRNELPRLVELRLQAAETFIEAELQLGHHASVLAEAERLAAEHPLRENLHGYRMLALCRSGRRADALAAYRQARTVIVKELGIEPGPELRELNERILCGDAALTVPWPRPAVDASSPTATVIGSALDLPDLPAAPSTPNVPGTPASAVSLAVPDTLDVLVPRQLPWVADGFVGRERELAALSALLDRAGERPPGAPVISVITGTAGVGKTALATQWAHQVKERFPGGQLYVNLRGYDQERPVPPADVLADFLRALGMPKERIPVGINERAAAFRSLLAVRPVLVFLDNARDAEQARPLLPGNSSCLALITSRDALPGLVALDGAQRVELDPLAADEAVRLLEELIGERSAAAPGTTARLASCCCLLPLALRVAAELVNARPSASLADLVAELSDQQWGLELLSSGGDTRTEVRAVFSWSYRHLDTATARAFRLASLHPGPNFDAHAVAALTGVAVQQARACLDKLVRAHLIQPAGSSRYNLHDLLRRYARELAHGQDGEEQCRASLTRLFDYYVHTAGTAAKVLYPAAPRHHWPVIPDSPVTIPLAADTIWARAWLDAERASLVTVAVHTADNGWPVHATALSAVLTRYLEVTFNPAEAQAIYSCGRRAARDCGNRNGEAQALNSLANVEWRLGRFPEAAGILRQALALYREAGDTDGEGRVLNNLASVCFELGRITEAHEFLLQALSLFSDAGDEQGKAIALNALGLVHERAGRYQEASDHIRQALALHRKADDQFSEAHALESLASVRLRMGRATEALEYSRQALAICRDVGDRRGEATALTAAGLVYERAGRYQEATDHIRQALALHRKAYDKSSEAHALNSLGRTLHAAGQPAEARAQYDAALRLASQTGSLFEQAQAHDGLGRVYRELGDLIAARRHWQQALARYTEMGTPEAEQVRAQLAGQGTPLVPERECAHLGEQAMQTGDSSIQRSSSTG